MNRNRSFYKKVIEALLFCAGKTLKPAEIARICDGIPISEVEEILWELQIEYRKRGINLKEVAGGYRVETAPEVAEYVKKLFQRKGMKWTNSLLETLAIIAYFQPITRAEISAKRGGVDVSSAIKILLERKMIKVVGKKDVPGRPILYGTTDFFLEYFGLKSLKDLPPLEEVKKLAGKEK